MSWQDGETVCRDSQPLYDVFDVGRPLRPRVRMCDECARRAKRIAAAYKRHIVIDGPIGDGVCQSITCHQHDEVERDDGLDF